MTEAFLQYLWQHRLLDGELATTTGLPVVVERPGELNRDAGPDFFGARVRIGDVLWAGNVEIHVKASDWKNHHHSEDENYDNVVLHVVYDYDFDVVTAQGDIVPSLEIRQSVPLRLWEEYQSMVSPLVPVDIPCMGRLQEIPDFIMNSYMDRLLVDRIERKSSDVRRLLNDGKGSWEDCCYWMVARYFGGKANGYAFEMLAKVTPMKYVAKIKDNPFRVEALLLGQAGLLENDFADEYPQKLKKEYNYLRIAYNLTPMAGHLWKFFRLRPASFPTIRISQLADLMCKSSGLFSRLLDGGDVSSLRQLFEVKASDYWNSHYQFDKESDCVEKHTGSNFVDLLLINAWVPLLFEYGSQHDNQHQKDRAVELLKQIPAENNRIIKLWQRAGLQSDNAARSQSLIQLYNEHCKEKHCLACQIGFQLLGGGRNRRQNLKKNNP